jgi:hypothetical protein
MRQFWPTKRLPLIHMFLGSRFACFEKRKLNRFEPSGLEEIGPQRFLGNQRGLSEHSPPSQTFLGRVPSLAYCAPAAAVSSSSDLPVFSILMATDPLFARAESRLREKSDRLCSHSSFRSFDQNCNTMGREIVPVLSPNQQKTPEKSRMETSGDTRYHT